jgi:hypothetical protein
MVQCRQAYIDLAIMLGTMTVIPALGLNEARQAVNAAAEPLLASIMRRAGEASGKLSAA